MAERPPQSAFRLGRGFAHRRSELAKFGVNVVSHVLPPPADPGLGYRKPHPLPDPLPAPRKRRGGERAAAHRRRSTRQTFALIRIHVSLKLLSALAGAPDEPALRHRAT